MKVSYLFNIRLKYLLFFNIAVFFSIYLSIHQSATHATPLNKQTPLVNVLKSSAQEQLTLSSSNYTILDQADHNRQSFTQGFDLDNGTFYESSGLYGLSFLEIYDKTNSLYKKNLPKNIFAEGFVKVDNELFLLTWRSGKLLVYDATDLSFKREKKYIGEGWGLTHNNKQFIMSNGSSSLFFRGKDDFKIKRTINAHDNKKSYSRLNELEYAKGYIWANMWQSPYVIKIRSFDGFVVKRYDLSKLVQKNSTRAGHTVLNGIAYSEKEDAFWLTGKLWPKRYLVKFND